MSKEKKDKPENKQPRSVTEILRESGAIDNYIELFYNASKETDTPMTEEHKVAMRQYTQGMASKWDTILEKMATSLEDPAARKELEKSLRQLSRIKNPKKKPE